MRYNLCLTLVVLLGIVVVIASQFSISTLFGADGYLHIRMAKLIRQYGIVRDFHWARYSTFAHNFADKDLLYHLMLIPFTFFSNIFLGAKVSACFFTVFLYLVFFAMLRRYCETKTLIPIFLIMFLCSAPFLQAISQPRNMIFIIALTLIYIHFLIKKNQGVLFVLTIIYALSHVSGPLLLVFAFLAEANRFIQEREFIFKSICTVALGLLVGFLIHPHFPNNFLVFYLNGILVPIYALKWGLELGAEFFPLDTRAFVLGYPFIFIGLLLLIALGMSEVQKIKLATRIWMSIAGFFFAFSFFSQRYIIHGYPLILISLASYFSDWWEAAERLPLLRQNNRVKAGSFALVLSVFVLLGFSVYRDFYKRALAEKIYNHHYESVAQWMSRYIPKGEVIFHSNWSDAQYFIGLNPQNDYFVTLDPIYMYYWNPKKYNLYRDIAFGRTKAPYNLLKEEFGVRYGYVGKNYFSGLIIQIRAEPGFEILAEDNLGLVFRLKP